MRLQESQNWCGPTALSNALLSLGRDIPPAACATNCRTTIEGTDEKDICRAITELGFEPVVVRNWFALVGAVTGGSPVVCSVTVDDPEDHWVAVIGVSGDRLIVVDSLKHELTEAYEKADWLEFWKGAPRGFYGVALV